MTPFGLTFIYAPVAALEPTLAFYRDVLGWDEAWREGEEAVAFRVPDSPVQVMVSLDELDEKPGAMYRVDDLVAFLADHPTLVITTPPREIPGGNVVAVDDGGGNTVYFFDFVDDAA
ncbi:MAG: hypothetical protein QM602_02365 [Microbacterium sp.]